MLTEVCTEPKPAPKDAYLKDPESNLLGNKKAKEGLIKAIKQQQTVVKRVPGDIFQGWYL